MKNVELQDTYEGLTGHKCFPDTHFSDHYVAWLEKHVLAEVEHIAELEKAQKFFKYSEITNKLRKYNIELDLEAPRDFTLIPIIDKDSGRKLGHNRMTWDSFPVDEVVAMIVSWKEKVSA
jgi:hypothetical protein